MRRMHNGTASRISGSIFGAKKISPIGIMGSNAIAIGPLRNCGGEQEHLN